MVVNHLKIRREKNKMEIIGILGVILGIVLLITIITSMFTDKDSDSYL